MRSRDCISKPRSRRKHKAWGASPREKSLLIHLEAAEWATASTLDVSFVVFNSIRFQEFNKLIAKRKLSVMLLLFRNISAYFFYVYLTHRECTVTTLPREMFE